MNTVPPPQDEPGHEHTQLTIARTGNQPRPLKEQREHYLTVIEGSEAGQSLKIGTMPVTLGRKPSCQLVLPDAEVSGQHCQVAAVAHRPDAVVTDLDSTNGTYVDGRRIRGTAKLPQGGLLQIGSQVIKHDYLLPSEMKQSQELDRDIAKASQYVQSLLPAPVRSGPIQANWFFLPSARLGGDAFGYHRLDEHSFAVYLMDVSGHGAGAAMHSVSVMNVLRQRALPGTDFRDPAQVLEQLNEMFQMDSHGGMFFSIWYGTYDVRTQQLRYASGGHHPSYLVDGARLQAQPLLTRNLVIGAMPGMPFRAETVSIPAGSRLYIFSDGVFELVTAAGGQWGLEDFLPLLCEPLDPAVGEPERLHRAVRAVARPGPFDDDVSIVVVTFL